MQDPDVSDATGKFEEWKASAERSVREDPLKAAGIAVGAGVLLAILPVARILGGLVRLGVLLLKPALLIFGVVKLLEACDGAKASESGTKGQPS